MSVQEHKRHARTNLRVGVLTASDTRTPADDKSGQLIKQMFEAAGHRVEFYRIVRDEAATIAAAISENLGNLDAMIVTGGTGVAPRDVTADVVKKLLGTELPGFGELFRMLSYQEIGSAALASRAIAGMLNGKFLAALPGSTGGCRLAMEKLILPELGHLVGLANPLANPKMNRLTIRLFATLRERAGTPELTREFSDDATVAQIWARLKAEFPALEGHRDAVRFAVNQEYVEDDYRPRPGDEIAFIPPVSGGSDAPAWMGPIRIVRDGVDVAALEAAVADPLAGAICTFVGTTRENNVGRKVLRLEYEAYEAMALSEIRKLADEAGRRWEITRIAITHRVGVVEIGETSVAIAVSAPHRAEAFEACRFAIDRLKEIVPIWKKEHFEGGEVWIGCQTSHPPHAHAAK